jgi:hypothetical protein
MARKVDKAAHFFFFCAVEQKPGLYGKRHPDYARQAKIDLAWERISHETKESGSCLSSFETIQARQFKLSQRNGCTQYFLFLILYSGNLLHSYTIYFRLKYNLLYNYPSFTLHRSDVYGHH